MDKAQTFPNHKNKNNKQQQGAKNNAELQAKWTKKTLKTFEVTIR
jgi:hypothetical protein